MISEALFYNQDKFPAIAQDYSDAKKRAEKITNEKASDDNALVNCAFESIPQFRRVEAVENKVKSDETGTALGLAGLALVNLPQDMADVKGAYDQIFNGAADAYDHKLAQHPFSFFRGTLLAPLVNPQKSPCPKLAKKILNSDMTLLKTTFGQKILNLLNTKKSGWEKTTIEAINSTDEDQKFIKANKYKGNGSFKSFGELTARAMERCTLWGLGVTALFELPQIVDAFKSGNNTTEKAENGTKQTVKSAIDIAATTAGMAYFGAIGSKYKRSAGSLIGMGIGAVVGNYCSKKLQDSI